MLKPSNKFNHTNIRILLAITLLFSPSLSHALTGEVISAADGDTITILDSANKQFKIGSTASTAQRRGKPSVRLPRSTQPV